jgi:hypothetical protein
LQNGEVFQSASIVHVSRALPSWSGSMGVSAASTSTRSPGLRKPARKSHPDE